MNILYGVATLSKGTGGHYYSLKETVEGMNGTVFPVLVNLQLGESPVFNSISGKKYKVNLKDLRIIWRIIDICRIENIHCIHAFDDKSYSFLRVVARLRKIPIVLTVCGGPVPCGYFPRVDYLAVFSGEQFDYFSKRAQNFHLKQLELLPGRVSDFAQDKVAINALSHKYSIEKELTILRISRISKKYESSLVQTIAFVKKLRELGLGFKLLIVGDVIHDDVLKNLKSKSGSFIEIESSNEFTLNAKKLIGISRYVVATGRSAMESMSRGLITLTPNSQGKYPILIDKSSFEACFFTNFSERNITNESDQESINRFLSVLEDRMLADELKDYYLAKYEEYFDVKKTLRGYAELYEIAEAHSGSTKDMLRDLANTYVSLISHSTPLNKNNIRKVWFRLKTFT